MTNMDHIFIPKDDSLFERIRAYRSTREAWLNADASLKHLDDPEWSDSLGEQNEVVEAHKICKRSFDTASRAISPDELKEAQSLGLLSDEEIRDIVQKSRSDDMKEARKGQKTDSHKHRCKR